MSAFPFSALNKLALLCVCLGLLVGCQGPYDQPHPSLFSGQPRLYPPQLAKPSASRKAFFQHLHYPYVASKARRRRIEWAWRNLDINQTPAQVLAELGPPDWKEEFDGYPPKIPPSETWCYVHTLERPLGPNYDGKLLLIGVNKTTPAKIVSMEDRGLQKVGR